MKRFIPLVILALFTQLLAIIMWGEYVQLNELAMGFAVRTPLQHIQPTLWIVFVAEIILLATYLKKNE